MDPTTETIYSAGEAARFLDVSPSGLRRYASIFEELYGDLPRDSQGGRSRVWTSFAIERLQAAKGLVAEGQAPSIRDALEALERGVTPASEPQTVTLRRDVVEALLTEVQAVRKQLNSVQRLEAEVRQLREQLEAPRGATPRELEVQIERERQEQQAAEAAARTQKEVAAVRNELANMRRTNIRKSEVEK